MKFSFFVEFGILGFGRFLEFGIGYEEFVILLMIRIWNLSFIEKDWILEFGIWN